MYCPTSQDVEPPTPGSPVAESAALTTVPFYSCLAWCTGYSGFLALLQWIRPAGSRVFPSEKGTALIQAWADLFDLSPFEFSP